MSLEIHPLKLGEVQLDSSFLVWQMNPGTPFVAPCTGYLILGGDTPVLVDSGFRNVVPPFTQTPEQTLQANLARHGLEPGDVGLVIHTHVHVDHCGLDDLLASAKILVQRSELEYAAAPLFPPFLYDPDDVARLSGPLRGRLELLDGDSAPAPGIRTVLTGGHSRGHQMLDVELDSGTAIITGDIVYLTDPGLTQQLPSGYWLDLADVMAGLERIKRDATHVLPMHDPSIYERYPEGVR